MFFYITKNIAMDEISDFFDLVIEREPFLHLLNECRKADKYTDVKLQLNDKLFPAHRTVLSLSSPVLKALISDRWSTTNVYPINDEYVDAEIMEDLLSFLYTGSIKLTSNNVHPICVAAHFLQIPTLLEPSVKYLCQFITIENVLTLFIFSAACELEELKHHCLRIVSKNKLFQTSEILKFSFKDLKDLIVGLNKFQGKRLREKTFHFIVRLTKKNRPERLNDLPDLLKSIPLEELPLKFLTETILKHSIMKDSVPALKTVSDALANYRTYSFYSNPPWKVNQNMVVLGGTVKNSIFSRAVHLYDARSGVWRKLPDMPSARGYCGATVVNHQDIVLCGGWVEARNGVRGNTNLQTASAVRFDWSTQTWTKLPKMPVICASSSAAICNDDLYVEGNGKKVLRYSFKTKKWKFVASLKSICRTMIEYKNCLYAIGGSLKTIQKYDPEQDKWTTMTKIVNNNVKAVTVHQHRIYILSSQDFESPIFEVYHPETNSFDTFPELPFSLYRTSLVSLNGKLLAVGGFDVYNADTIDLIFEFDFLTGKWIEFGKMPGPLSFNLTVVGAFH